MSFSAEWEAKFSSGKNQSIWPWSDLVSAVMQRADPSRPPRVLELGCAVGANVPLFLALQADYYGVEGSASARQTLIARFPQLSERVVVADFTQSLHFDGQFDLIVDRSSVTHNARSAIENTLKLVLDSLKPGGRFIGIDWFSTKQSGTGEGRVDTDEFTRTDFKSGRFAGVGRVHFSDEPHLRELFSAFEIEMLEEKVIERKLPLPPQVNAWWNIVARKPT